MVHQKVPQRMLRYFFYASSPSGRVHASRKRSHSPRGDRSLKNAPQERFLNAPADGAPKKCLAEKQGIFLLCNIAEMRNSVQTGTRTARPAAMRPGRGQQSSGLLESARESPRGAPKNAATNVAVFFYAPSPPGRLRASLCGSHSPRGDRSLKTFHRSVFLTLLLFGKAKWRKRHTGGVAPVRPDVVEIEKERLTCR